MFQGFLCETVPGFEPVFSSTTWMAAPPPFHLCEEAALGRNFLSAFGRASYIHE
jgi:hypothetical protein